MPRFFVKSDQIIDNTINVLGKDVRHIKNVLRREVGDIIEICNQEDGKSYRCEIVQLKNDEILCDIKKNLENQKDRIKVDIYQGLPKSDKMELIIQKSVELGVNAIIPVNMKRCVVKIDAKDENKKIERWQKIAESAAKQCGRNTIPEIRKIATIQNIINLKENYDAIIVAYENEKKDYIKTELLNLKKHISDKDKLNIAVVIGPEGGLEENDVELLRENGAKIVTLGSRILRTETVALNVLSIIMYELEN